MLLGSVGVWADEAENIVIQNVSDNVYQFEMPEGNVQLTITYNDGGTAVVSVADGEVKQVVWYDAAGRRLPSAPNKAGVYIKNGKLTVVK
jgi:hypothetical protein